MAIKKKPNKQKNTCTLLIKNVDCELMTYFRESATTNDRSLSKEIINILKRVKERRENEGDNLLLSIPQEDLSKMVLKQP